MATRSRRRNLLSARRTIDSGSGHHRRRQDRRRRGSAQRARLGKGNDRTSESRSRPSPTTASRPRISSTVEHRTFLAASRNLRRCAAREMVFPSFTPPSDEQSRSIVAADASEGDSEFYGVAEESRAEVTVSCSVFSHLPHATSGLAGRHAQCTRLLWNVADDSWPMERER